MTPIAERAAMSSHQRRPGGPNQHAMTAATEIAMLATPSGIINRPIRCECDANQAWKSPGGRFFQKLTKETPITSMPPARRPRTRQVSIISVDVTTDRNVMFRSPSECTRPHWTFRGRRAPSLGREHAKPVFFFQDLGRREARARQHFRQAGLGLARVGRKAERERGGGFQDATDLAQS